jgi:DNA-binding response OmpR family regulator
MKILIVDDETGMLNALQAVLGTCGHEVICAETAQAGLDANPNSFDFVLLDYKMPKHDGGWFMKKAKIGRGTRVLLITAYVNKDVIKRMFSLGVSGYLIKPFDADDLIRHIDFFAGDAEASEDDELTSSALA